MENSLKNAMDLYNASATLTGLYWNMYLVVITGILGYLFSKQRALSKVHRSLLIFVFLVFTTGNLMALINKQSLHFAMAHEVVKAAKAHPPKSDDLTKKLGSVSFIPSGTQLHGTRWPVTTAIHILFDILVILSIAYNGNPPFKKPKPTT